MSERSIGVIGVGRLGSDVALVLAERDFGDIVLYDTERERAEYLASDLRDTSFGRVYHSRITWARQLRDLARCDLVLLAAGKRLDEIEPALELFRANKHLVAEVADAFVGSSTLFVVATEPVDLITHALARALRLPPSRVLGIGGIADSYRLRHAIGEAFSINTDYIRGQVIGPSNHQVHVLWEYCSINGVPLRTLATESRLRELEEQFTAATRSRVRVPGDASSRYTPAMAAAELIRTLVKDDRRVISVTMPWTNILGISDVSMSVPAVIGRFGAEHPVVPPLSDTVMKSLQETAATYSRILREDG